MVIITVLQINIEISLGVYYDRWYYGNYPAINLKIILIWKYSIIKHSDHITV